jgi:putative flippase GtrA
LTIVRSGLARLLKLGPVLAGTLILLAVIAINGRPSVFTDSDDYYNQGQTIYHDVRDSLSPPAALTDPEAIEAAAKTLSRERFSLTSKGARSVFYGIFLFAGVKIGSLWLVAAIQAALAVWPAWRLSRAIAPKARSWTLWPVALGVAAGTSLPLFAGFAMPDVFAGVAILCTVLLLVYRQTLIKGEQILIWGLLAVSLSFHGSHTMTALGLAIIGAGLMLLFKAEGRETLFRAGLIVAAVVAGFAANAFYGQVIKAKWGEELRRPPFLAARVLADGPGRTYLRDACRSGTPYVLCRFRKQDLNNSDKILWSGAAGVGIFNRLSYEDRIALGKEEFRFAFNTVLHDPLGQIAASAQNWWWQLNLIYVEDPLRNPYVFLNDAYWGKTKLPLMIPDAETCKADRAACRARLRMDPLRAWHTSVLLLAAGFLAWRLLYGEVASAFRRKRMVFEDDAIQAMTAVGLLLIGFVVNAAVCGILSGPFPRYQARVAWLIPLAATVVAQRLAKDTPAQTWAAMVHWGQGLFLKILSLLRRVPLFDRLLTLIDPAFIRFCVVGGAGFVVDASVLYGLVWLAGLDHFTARLGSFVVAMFSTWTLNRLWTFKARAGRNPAKEAGLYFLVQCTGGAVNIATYSLAIAVFPLLGHWLVIPLAMGTAAGLVINFLGTKHIAFREQPAA